MDMFERRMSALVGVRKACESLKSAKHASPLTRCTATSRHCEEAKRPSHFEHFLLSLSHWHDILT